MCPDFQGTTSKLHPHVLFSVLLLTALHPVRIDAGSSQLYIVKTCRILGLDRLKKSHVLTKTSSASTGFTEGSTIWVSAPQLDVHCRASC